MCIALHPCRDGCGETTTVGLGESNQLCMTVALTKRYQNNSSQDSYIEIAVRRRNCSRADGLHRLCVGSGSKCEIHIEAQIFNAHK